MRSSPREREKTTPSQFGDWMFPEPKIWSFPTERGLGRSVVATLNIGAPRFITASLPRDIGGTRFVLGCCFSMTQRPENQPHVPIYDPRRAVVDGGGGDVCGCMDQSAGDDT